MRLLGSAAIALWASALLAAPPDAALSACDEAIAHRQVKPSLYTRIGFQANEITLSRAVVEQQMREVGVRAELLTKRLSEYDTGTFRPRIITLIIDYQATKHDGELVTKRSECVIRLNRPSDLPTPSLAIVDGTR